MCSVGFYDGKCDVWAVGCIFAELFIRQKLFHQRSRTALDQLKNVFEVLGTPSNVDWIKDSNSKRLIEELEPRDAKPWKEVLGPTAHDGAVALISVMLVLDPSHRCSPMQCLQHPSLKTFYRKKNVERVMIAPFDWSFELDATPEAVDDMRSVVFAALEEWRE